MLFPKKLRALFWVMLFDHTSANITFPVLTFIFFSHASWLFPENAPLHTRTLWYGLCISVAHLGGLISSPIMSTLSDTWGRKKLLLLASFAALIFAFSCTLGILYASVALLFFGKLVGGFLSRTNPIAQAIVGDLSQPSEKITNMALLQFVISIGAFLGPVLGGYLASSYFFNTINFSLPYIVAGIISLISIICVIFLFKESLTTTRSLSRSVASWWGFIRDKKIQRISLLLILTQVAWSFYYQFVPPILKVIFHYKTDEVGWFIGLIALWLAVSSFFLVRIMMRYTSQKTLVRVSLLLMLLGGVLFLVALFPVKNLHRLVWLSAVPIALGDVMIYSVITALYSNVVSAESQGTIMGLCFVVTSAVWGVTGLVGGMVGAIHLVVPLIISVAILMLISIMSLVRPILIN